jgi:hypothetical protein
MYSRNNYSSISQLGSNTYSPSENPLTYCLGANIDNEFMHGSSAASIIGQHSKACQAYLSDYCSKNPWDAFCEFASKNTSRNYPNQLEYCQATQSFTDSKSLTSGEILVHNTAKKKYLKSMGNCKKKYEPFDPTVANSPLISYWVNDSQSYSSTCVPIYGVDSTKIDNDPVMNKILNKPIIGIDILINIYNTKKREGTLKELSDTRLGKFYRQTPYFKSRGGLM